MRLWCFWFSESFDLSKARLVVSLTRNARDEKTHGPRDRICFVEPSSRRRFQKTILFRAAPRYPANTSRRQIEICQRSPFLKTSNAKSWGPLWGSDLVIDGARDKNTCFGWMVSRSDAIHLISVFCCFFCVALGVVLERILGEARRGFSFS